MKRIFALTLLFSVAASAALYVTRIRDSWWHSAAVYFGPGSNPPTPTLANGLDVLCRGSVTHDFGVTHAGNCTSTTQDAGSATITLPNCAATTTGSSCLVNAVVHADDGGVNLSDSPFNWRCYVSSRSGTSAVATIKLCALSSDAGTYNPGPGPLNITVVE